MQPIYLSSKETAQLLGVTRAFLLYHEDWFKPLIVGGRRIYSGQTVVSVYSARTELFPKADESVRKAALKVQQNVLGAARPQ